LFLLGCVLLLLLPLALPASGTNYEVLEVGLLAPNPTPTGQLLTGQVGYMLVSGQEGFEYVLMWQTWLGPIEAGVDSSSCRSWSV
jgi:hypothetical protein